MRGERLEEAPSVASASRPDPGFWRRYRPPLLAALPSGAIAGALTAAGVQLDGLGEGADATSAVATALLCADIGVLVAAVAAAGAVVAVLLAQQRLRAQRRVGFRVIAAGAGIAVGGATLLAGLAAGSGDQAWLPVVLLVALAAAALAAAAAAVVTALALRWRRSPR